MASLAELRMEEPDEIAIEPAARPEELRILEALLFASAEPLEQATLAKRMPDGVDIKAALARLQAEYANRGVNLIRVANKWTFRTAGDLAWLMTRESTETRKLSRAAIEVLAIVAYHQPVTRAEIEEIRGVVTSKGTLDVLLETGWIKPRGRRKTPGRPLTFGTTDAFLAQFSLETLGDLPGLEELKGTGLLDSRLPTGFTVPTPSDDPTLREDEEPLDPGDLDLALAPAVEIETDDAEAAESETAQMETAATEAAEVGSGEAETADAETAALTDDATSQVAAAVLQRDRVALLRDRHRRGRLDATSQVAFGDMEASNTEANAEIVEASVEDFVTEQDDDAGSELLELSADEETQAKAQAEVEADAAAEADAPADEADRDTDKDGSEHPEE